jgi:hypothetical protein
MRRVGASEAVQISANRGELPASCKAAVVTSPYSLFEGTGRSSMGCRICDDLAGFAGIDSVPRTG